jgi:hypothetical protein
MTPHGQLDRSLFPGVLWATAFYAALTIVFAYPLSVHPGSTVFGDNPDTHFYMWTLSWDVHAFLHQPLRIFDANIFYPNRLTLAYSENQIGSAVFAAPILWLTSNPVLAVNLVALIGCALCGTGGYVLCRRIGLDATASTIGGLAFAFAPARFVRTGQAYLGTMQWIPFALASLHAYFDEGTKRHLRWAAAFFSLEALTSGHGGVLLTFAALALVVFYLMRGEPIAPLKRLRDLGMPGALLLLPSALLYVPYRQVQVEMGLRRSLEDWAPTFQSFLASPTHFQQWVLSLMPGLRVNELASANLLPGYLPLALALIAVGAGFAPWRTTGATATAAGSTDGRARMAVVLDVAALAAFAIAGMVLSNGPLRLRIADVSLLSVRGGLQPAIVGVAVVVARLLITRARPFGIRSFRTAGSAERPRDPTLLYAALTVLGVWISMGPPLGIWPLIYWLPGVNFIRLSSRFMLLAMLGLAVLSAIGFTRLAARFGSRAGLTAMIAALMIGEFAGMPLPVTPYRVTIPAIDRWLSSRPTPFAVAEFPTVLNARYQTAYMLHSMAHWQKTVHGYSGFEPPQHTRLYQELRGFPDDVSLQRLGELRVTYLVVHPDMYRPAEWKAVEGRLREFGDRLTLEHEEAEEAGRVYSLRPFR